MGYEYAWVHLQYTIPPAVALTFLYRPLSAAIDVYKVVFLILIAVVATTPWDSYLIHHAIWTYPERAVLGPTFFRIPLEEVFFFVVQTYNTSLLYLLLSKPVFHPVYLRGEQSWQDGRHLKACKIAGQMGLCAGIFAGSRMIAQEGQSLYLGLIISWVGPFALLLWSLSYQFILGLPLTSTLVPIAVPTLYLCLVDTLALRRGTWVIQSGTKLGFHLWDGLDIEEAVFFLATNVLIVFGQIAFDNALAVLDGFPAAFPLTSTYPSPATLVQALLLPAAKYDQGRLKGMREAISRLRRKSRSFYLASSVFPRRLRIDLTLLYSFCRVADDLIDDAPTLEEAQKSVTNLDRFLNLTYSSEKLSPSAVADFVVANFPPESHAALLLLPTSCLSQKPLYGLVRGFEIDLQFSNGQNSFPISGEGILMVYGHCVAGTVARLCIELVYHHTHASSSPQQREAILLAGERMGMALQLVNIARDIQTDAYMGRCYLPTHWLRERGLTPLDVVEDPTRPEVDALRQKMLDRATELYRAAKPAIEGLPIEARGPMRVAVESYMEISRVLRTPGYRVKRGRATVPMWRRIQVAWRALNER